MPDSSSSIIAEMMARLPSGSLVGITDVCAAWDRDRDVVEGWIESGEVDAIDLGGGKNKRWELSRSSLEAFLHRRAAGLRAPAERRLSTRQRELFPNFFPDHP